MKVVVIEGKEEGCEVEEEETDLEVEENLEDEKGHSSK